MVTGNKFFWKTNFVFNITNENNKFSSITPDHWSSRCGAETIHNLQKLLELRSENDIELHVEVEKRGNKLKREDKDYILSDRDTQWNEITDKSKSVEHHDHEDMVYRLELTYTEIDYILDTKYIAATSTGYTLPLGIYETSDINLILKSLLPDGEEINTTVDDIRLK